MCLGSTNVHSAKKLVLPQTICTFHKTGDEQHNLLNVNMSIYKYASSPWSLLHFLNAKTLWCEWVLKGSGWWACYSSTISHLSCGAVWIDNSVFDLLWLQFKHTLMGHAAAKERQTSHACLTQLLNCHVYCSIGGILWPWNCLLTWNFKQGTNLNICHGLCWKLVLMSRGPLFPLVLNCIVCLHFAKCFANCYHYINPVKYIRC